MPADTEFKFAHVAFFGRGLQEYVAMFDLDIAALKGKQVLDCSAGPASFALEASEKGINVVAADPMYSMTVDELRKSVDQDANAVTQKQASNKQYMHAEVVPTSERRKSMELFLKDFEQGKETGRYVAAELPTLPFKDNEFDMVVCGNLLFEYSDVQSGGMLTESLYDYAFHSVAIEDLLRVCRGELRIYPLIAPGGKEHAFLKHLMNQFSNRGFEVSLEPVAQRDIVGAEQMLKIKRTA